MTDYAELVKKLRNRRVCLQTGLNLDNDYPLLREAADAIEQLTADLERSKEWEAFWEKEANEALKKFQTTVARMPRWILVTERLPGLHEEVLVCNEEYGLSGLGFATVAVWDGTDWIETWDRRDAIHCVSHWMPLPEPPTPVMEYPQVDGITSTLITPEKEERGCPPDYNPGFCYGDEDCDACWEGWRKEQEETE